MELKIKSIKNKFECQFVKNPAVAQSRRTINGMRVLIDAGFVRDYIFLLNEFRQVTIYFTHFNKEKNRVKIQCN